MIALDLHILEENPDCQALLQAYADWEKSPENTTNSSWRERWQQESGEEEVNESRWTNAHGLLIAYGWIEVELVGRSLGIHYRISSDGKRAMANLQGNPALAYEETQELAEESSDEQVEQEELAA